MSTIEHFSETQHFSELLDEMDSKTNELIDKGLQVYDDIEHTELVDSERSFKNGLKHVRMILNDWLDLWEASSLEELNNCSYQAYSTLKEYERAVLDSLQCLNETKQLLNKCTVSEYKTRICVINQNFRTAFEMCHKAFQSTQENLKHCKIHFSQRRNLSKLREQFDSLENVDIVEPFGYDIERKVLTRVRPLKIDTVVVKQPDKMRARITAIVFTQTGELLAADSRNRQLLLLDAGTMKILGTCAYPTMFFYIHLAAVNDCLCLSAVPGTRDLQFIQIKPQFRIGKRKQLDSVCHAMTASEGNIILLCSSEETYSTTEDQPTSQFNNQLESQLSDHKKSALEVIVMDLHVIVLKTFYINNKDIKLAPNANYNISASLDGQTLFLSQNIFSVKSSVICMTTSGRHVYTYDEPMMKGIRGIIPDAENNILVCSDSQSGVFVLAPGGRKHKVLLALGEDIRSPNTIALRVSDEMLIIADEGKTGIGDRLNVFNMNWH